jgi:hypothetical protein
MNLDMCIFAKNCFCAKQIYKQSFGKTINEFEYKVSFTILTIDGFNLILQTFSKLLVANPCTIRDPKKIAHTMEQYLKTHKQFLYFINFVYRTKFK